MCTALVYTTDIISDNSVVFSGNMHALLVSVFPLETLSDESAVFAHTFYCAATLSAAQKVRIFSKHFSVNGSDFSKRFICIEDHLSKLKTDNDRRS